MNTAGVVGTLVPGCSVADDFSHALGSPLEGRMAAALNYRLNGSCPAATGVSPDTRIQSVELTSEASRLIHRPFWRESLILPR